MKSGNGKVRNMTNWKMTNLKRNKSGKEGYENRQIRKGHIRIKTILERINPKKDKCEKEELENDKSEKNKTEQDNSEKQPSE